jgi:adenosylcobinamide-phosphate synthase
MELLQPFNDRLFLLVLGHFAALVVGSMPHWLHSLLLYDAPAKCCYRVLSFLERRLNRSNRPASDRTVRGRLILWLMALLAVGIGAVFSLLTLHTHYGWYGELVVITYLVPLRACIQPAFDIKRLRKDKKLPLIPAVLSPWTDADTEGADGYALLRITVTHLARALPRYVIAPSCWYLVLGLPGLMLCRLVTLCADMFPHTHARYRAFSLSMHRWDRFFHVVPTRLAVLAMWPGLLCVPQSSVRQAVQAFTRKPAEAPVTTATLPVRLAAYGLGISLGGPYVAGGIHRPEPWIGSGRAMLTMKDISRTLIWYSASAVIWLAGLTALVAFK